MVLQDRRKTVGVMVGHVQVGGGAPVVVQSMTNTDTEDPASTAQQIIALADAGSELVRLTVNTPEAAAAEVVHGLSDFFIAVHHKWAVTHHRFVDRFTRQPQQRDVVIRFKLHGVVSTVEVHQLTGALLVASVVWGAHILGRPAR